MSCAAKTARLRCHATMLHLRRYHDVSRCEILSGTASRNHIRRPLCAVFRSWSRSIYHIFHSPNESYQSPPTSCNHASINHLCPGLRHPPGNCASRLPDIRTFPTPSIACRNPLTDVLYLARARIGRSLCWRSKRQQQHRASPKRACLRHHQQRSHNSPNCRRHFEWEPGQV